jgi:hypothetical protein
MLKPSCFNNRPTRGVFGPELFKAERLMQKRGEESSIEGYEVMVREGGRDVFKGEFKVKVDLAERGQTSI